MKKIFLTTFLFLMVSLFATAQEQQQTAEVSYVNIPVYKVYEHEDVYQVMYLRSGAHFLSKMMIPKTWFKPESQKKGVVRNLGKNLEPYVTIVYRNGEFSNVILNMPPSRRHSVWSFLPPGTVIADDIKNAETLSFKL